MKLNFFHAIGVIMIASGSIIHIFTKDTLYCLYTIVIGLCMFEVFAKVYENNYEKRNIIKKKKR